MPIPVPSSHSSLVSSTCFFISSFASPSSLIMRNPDGFDVDFDCKRRSSPPAKCVEGKGTSAAIFNISTDFEFIGFVKVIWLTGFPARSLSGLIDDPARVLILVVFEVAMTLPAAALGLNNPVLIAPAAAPDSSEVGAGTVAMTARLAFLGRIGGCVSNTALGGGRTLEAVTAV